MKAPFLSVLALVAVAFCGVAQAGPVSTLYLAGTYQLNGGSDIVVVQGNTITTFPEAYASPYEIPIAVWGDVRTSGYYATINLTGGQYTLGGTPTGTVYTLLGISNPSGVYDSTTDGSHNYLVAYGTGWVYQTARDFTNPIAVFNSDAAQLGITYDAANNSLWVSGYGNNIVTDYSLSGGSILSFSTGHSNGALALDPADHTLWLVNSDSGNLEQYSTAGVLLSTGPYVGLTYGGEFDLQPTATPEPGTFLMLGSGILGLASLLRRKINL
jgi:hypothetical protein